MVRGTVCICLLTIVGPWVCGCDDSSEHPAAPGPPVERVAPPVPKADSEPLPPETASSSETGGPDLAETMPATSPALVPTQPAGTLPFQPLADAKVGEWAVYKALDLQTVRYEIRKVGLTRVETEVTVTLDGQPLGMPATREDRRDADPLAWEPPAGASRQISRTTIAAAGRDWSAILYEDRWTDEEVRYVRKTWVSNAAPVFGIIRMELTGDNAVEARLELIEAVQK